MWFFNEFTWKDSMRYANVAIIVPLCDFGWLIDWKISIWMGEQTLGAFLLYKRKMLVKRRCLSNFTNQTLIKILVYSLIKAHKIIFWVQVGLLNVDGFYNSLLSFIDKAVDEGFISPTARRIIVSAPTAKQLVRQLEVKCFFNYYYSKKKGYFFEHSELGFYIVWKPLNVFGNSVFWLE